MSALKEDIVGQIVEAFLSTNIPLDELLNPKFVKLSTNNFLNIKCQWFVDFITGNINLHQININLC